MFNFLILLFVYFCNSQYASFSVFSNSNCSNHPVSKNYFSVNTCLKGAHGGIIYRCDDHANILYQDFYPDDFKCLRTSKSTTKALLNNCTTNVIGHPPFQYTCETEVDSRNFGGVIYLDNEGCNEDSHTFYEFQVPGECIQQSTPLLFSQTATQLGCSSESIPLDSIFLCWNYYPSHIRNCSGQVVEFLCVLTDSCQPQASGGYTKIHCNGTSDQYSIETWFDDANCLGSPNSTSIHSSLCSLSSSSSFYLAGTCSRAPQLSGFSYVYQYNNGNCSGVPASIAGSKDGCVSTHSLAQQAFFKPGPSFAAFRADSMIRRCSFAANLSNEKLVLLLSMLGALFCGVPIIYGIVWLLKQICFPSEDQDLKTKKN